MIVVIIYNIRCSNRIKLYVLKRDLFLNLNESNILVQLTRRFVKK